MVCQSSISTEQKSFGLLSDSSDSIPVDCHNLNIVTSVDVSLSDRVDDVLGRVDDLFLALGQHLDLEVVADELVVQNGRTKLGA
mgnify:CR=1 FL=1